MDHRLNFLPRFAAQADKILALMFDDYGARYKHLDRIPEDVTVDDAQLQPTSPWQHNNESECGTTTSPSFMEPDNGRHTSEEFLREKEVSRWLLLPANELDCTVFV